MQGGKTELKPHRCQMSRLQMTAAGRGWKKLRHIRTVMVRNRAVYDLTGQFFTSHHLPGSEKTRPVAISSTTLQPHFRFHLNATCAVRDDPHTQVDREKKTQQKKNWNDFDSICFRGLLTCRCSWNRIGSIWAISGGISPFEESVRKERGRGEQEKWMFCPFWP